MMMSWFGLRKPNWKVVTAAAIALMAPVPTTVSAQAPAPGVNDEIVIGKSIGGVSLGDTPDQVLRKGGTTDVIGHDPDGRVNEILYGADVYSVSVVKLDVVFYPQLEGNPSYALFTASPTARTPEGIHVGSTVEELKRAYGDRAKMKTVSNGVEIYSISQSDGSLIGDRTTDFSVLYGKVQGIGINAVHYFNQAVH